MQRRPQPCCSQQGRRRRILPRAPAGRRVSRFLSHYTRKDRYRVARTHASDNPLQRAPLPHHRCLEKLLELSLLLLLQAGIGRASGGGGLRTPSGLLQTRQEIWQKGREGRMDGIVFQIR